MKLIIDIPEDRYRQIKNMPNAFGSDICKAIRNGTPYEERPQGDLISREVLKEVISTCDKFACLPDTRLVPFYRLANAEKNYVPYVHFEDIVKVIDNAPTVEYPFYAEAYQTGYEEGKNARTQGEWKDHSEEGYVECPFCEHLTNCEDNIDELHYCWNCGAYMQKGGAE